MDSSTFDVWSCLCSDDFVSLTFAQCSLSTFCHFQEWWRLFLSDVIDHIWDYNMYHRSQEVYMSLSIPWGLSCFRYHDIKQVALSLPHTVSPLLCRLLKPQIVTVKDWWQTEVLTRSWCIVVFQRNIFKQWRGSPLNIISLIFKGSFISLRVF